MSGPWEKYQAADKPTAEGPWSKFQPATPKEELGLIDKGFKVAEDAGSAVMNGPVGKGVAWLGDKFDRYVDAPFRAQIGAIQDGTPINPLDPFKAAREQFGKEQLPTTPSGKEMMARAGFSTKPLSEALPGIFSETGEGAALKKGGIADVSPAGVAGGLAQPSTFALPVGPIVGGAQKVVGASGRLAKLAASPLVDAVDAMATKAKSGLLKTGEVLTGGNLNAAKALKATEKLSGRELLFPGTENFGPLKKAGDAVGAARTAIPDSVIVPGSKETLKEVREIIVKGQDRALKTPGSQAVLEKLDNLIASDADIPLQTVDDLVRNLDEVGYTAQGNERSLNPMWKGPVSQSRSKLNSLISTVDEGKPLQAAKDKYSALATATKGRSKLMEGFSTIGQIGSTGTLGMGLATGNPLVAAAGAVTATAAKAMSPRTYFQIIGAAKLPKDAATALWEAYSNGKPGVIKQTASALAEQYPEEMGRFVTALARETDSSLSNATDTMGRDSAMKRRINSK
jgi:hypothetical protein